MGLLKHRAPPPEQVWSRHVTPVAPDLLIWGPKLMDTVELPLLQRFDYQGRTVAWGKMGAGAPLVMVHGTPFSSQVWRRIAPWIAQDHTVYLFDLLGYGQSDMSGGDVSLGVQNNLLMALISEWALDRPEVVAHDFGAATVLRAYYLNGFRPRRLTLIDPVAMRPWGSPFVTHVRQYEAAFADLPAYAHTALLEAYLQTASHRGLPSDALAIYARPWMTALGQPAFYRQIAQMDQRYTDEIEPRYTGPLECDLTLIWGAQDQWIPLSIGQRLNGLLKPQRFIPAPGAGHLVQDDAPEAIVEALRTAVAK